MNLKYLSAGILAVVLLNASVASAQTKTSKASIAGMWKLDLQQSTFSGPEPAPKSLNLTVLKDTPALTSWRIDGVDDKGNPFAYSWSGPADGSLQPLKAPDGKELGKESLKREGDVLLRHGEGEPGTSFDGLVTMSAEGNTMTDVVTTK